MDNHAVRNSTSNDETAMSCEAFRPFMDPYVDGEFDERDAAEMEAHLDACEECRAEVEERLRIKEALKDSERPCCPDALRQQIMCGLKEQRREPGDREGGREEEGEGRSGWAYAAATVPAAAGLALVLWFFPALTVAPASSGQLPVVEQTVEWHRNNLPVEISSPQRNHVAEWFRGKVDFPVRLPEFGESRVELIGGRLAHVQDRRAAYVAYEVDGARLSVMMFHGDGVKVPTNRIRRIAGQDVAVLNNKGFGVAVMRNHGITYAMTSDLPDRELVDVLVSALESQSKRQAAQ